jgi:hypothetical protein
MVSRRLVLAHLALAAALPGCFDSHGIVPGGDAGPATDAGMCRALPGSVMELRCEMRGDVGHAILSTAPSLCCSSGTPSTEIETFGTSTGTAHEIGVSWSACDCCEACRCLGPIQEVDVSLGVLSPGNHFVSAGGLSCTIAHFPPMPTCHPGTADEARFPRHIYPHQSFAATTVAASGGCGCSPRLDPPGPDPIDLASVSLCDCCDVCDCIDFGYELNVVVGPLGLGAHPVVTPHGSAEVLVVAPDATYPVDPPTSLRIVSPDESRTATGPRIDWAVVGGDEVVCCTPPAPVIDSGVGPAGEIALSVMSANLVDCDCVGRPTPYEAWFPLVSLPSGEHVVRAGALTATVVVP